MASLENSRQLIREGVVSCVYPERHSARVCFSDKDNLISAELPVLQSCAFGNKSYCLPDIGSGVVCLMATNGDDGTGWILGSRYHEKSTPAVNSQDKTRMDFSDGTFIEYDRQSHELNINCVGDIKINGKRIFLNE